MTDLQVYRPHNQPPVDDGPEEIDVENPTFIGGGSNWIDRANQAINLWSAPEDRPPLGERIPASTKDTLEVIVDRNKHFPMTIPIGGGISSRTGKQISAKSVIYYLDPLNFAHTRTTAYNDENRWLGRLDIPEVVGTFYPRLCEESKLDICEDMTQKCAFWRDTYILTGKAPSWVSLVDFVPYKRRGASSARPSNQANVNTGWDSGHSNQANVNTGWDSRHFNQPNVDTGSYSGQSGQHYSGQTQQHLYGAVPFKDEWAEGQ